MRILAEEGCLPVARPVHHEFNLVLGDCASLEAMVRARDLHLGMLKSLHEVKYGRPGRGRARQSDAAVHGEVQPLGVGRRRGGGGLRRRLLMREACTCTLPLSANRIALLARVAASRKRTVWEVLLLLGGHPRCILDDGGDGGMEGHHARVGANRVFVDSQAVFLLHDAFEVLHLQCAGR